jgi:hypothetical protein
LQLSVIVNLAVVDHPNVRHAWYANRLHAVQVVHNGQTVKAERAIGKVAHTFEPKAVRTAMRNGEATFHLFVHIDLRTKNTPNTAHFSLSLFFILLLKSYKIVLQNNLKQKKTLKNEIEKRTIE